jgi:hypothetical protein
MRIVHFVQVKHMILSFIVLSPLFSQSQQDLRLTEKMEEKLVRGEIISSVEQLPDSETHKCQTMGIVYYPIEEVWKILGEYNSYAEFMPHTSVAFLVNPDVIGSFKNLEISDWDQFEKEIEKHKISQFDNSPFYFYNRFNIPWPWKDRHYILKMERNDKEYFSHWIEIIGNTKVNRGSWKLMPFRGNNLKTLAVYTLITDPGINLSPGLSKLGTRISLPGVIKALRKRLLKKQLEEKRK